MNTRIAHLLVTMTIAATAVSMPAVARAETPTAAEKAQILELLEVTGIKQLMGEMSGMMLSQLQTMAADVPDSKWDELKPRIAPSNLIDMSIPVYARHFTSAEVKELVAFYRTPLGQKTINAMPAAIKESMTVSQQWGRETGNSIIEELKGEGYEVKAPSRPPHPGARP